jgi:hypothetical protein
LDLFKAEEENLLKNNEATNSDSKKQRSKDEEVLSLKYRNPLKRSSGQAGEGKARR